MSDDLTYLADQLELPYMQRYCADQVVAANGETTEFILGAEDSPTKTLGHVNSGVLFLRCTLDEVEPFVLEGGTCDSTPNIPVVEEESSQSGVAATGSITSISPQGTTGTSLSDVSFAFAEIHYRGGMVAFTLTELEAEADDVGVGRLFFAEPHVRMVAPAMGSVEGETVTFAAHSLRMEVSARVSVDGEVLHESRRMSGVFSNSGPATAVRTADGRFAFVEVPFEVGEHAIVLSTQAAAFAP